MPFQTSLLSLYLFSFWQTLPSFGAQASIALQSSLQASNKVSNGESNQDFKCSFMQHPVDEIMAGLLSIADILVWTVIFLLHLTSVKSMLLNNPLCFIANLLKVQVLRLTKQFKPLHTEFLCQNEASEVLRNSIFSNWLELHLRCA